MAFENQSQKDFVEALESREQELGSEVVDQQAVDDLLSNVVERIESLDESLQGEVLDGFNDLLGRYEVEVAYVSISSKEPLAVFGQDLESKIVDIIGLSDPELVRLFTDVSVLEGQVASAKSDLDAKQENTDTLIIDLDSKTQQREILIQEFHEIIGDRSLLGDLDSYLHASSYLLLGAGFFIKRFNLHDTDYEEKARDLFAQLVTLDKEIREFSPQLQVSSRELQSAQLKYYESSYRLQNLVGLDASEIAMDAYLALGSQMPKYMQGDVQERVKEFEQFHIDQINGAIHLPATYLNWLKKEVSEDTDTPLNRTDLSTILAAFDTPGSVVRKILEHKPRPGYNGEGFDPHIFMSKEDRRTIPADKHYRVKHCGEARKLIAAGFTGLAHSSEEFLEPGLSKRQERRNMIFYKKVGGNILVQQMVEKRFLKEGTYDYAESYYSLEAALPLKVYRESEIHELLEFDRQYAAYNKADFMRKPEVSTASSFASKIAPGLQSMQKAVGNRGAKTEEYVKYFKGEAQSLLEKIRGGKDEFLAQKSNLNTYKSQLEQTSALAMSHDVREQVLKTLNSTLKLMKMIEDGSLEKTLARVVSPNFHADSFDSWFMEEGIVLVTAVTVAVAITYATVGFGSGASSLLLTSAVSSAGGVLGAEIGLGISHVVGQSYFGEGYENLPLALQGKSLGELAEAYGKQFAFGFVMSVAAIGCGRVLGARLSEFLTKNADKLSKSGSVARFVSRFPGMSTKIDMVSQMNSASPMKFGSELLEELFQEGVEGVAEKFDSRLGFLMAVMFCSRPAIARMHFDGASVGIVSSVEVDSTQKVEMLVDRDLSQEYLQQKFPDSEIVSNEDGSFVVTHKCEEFTQVVTMRKGGENLQVLSRLPLSAHQTYGLNVSADGSLTFDSLDLGEGKVSLPGYLKSMGYKVQVDEVDGVKVLRVQGKSGNEFEIKPSVDSVQGVESQHLGDFASVDLSQDVSECEFEGYKVTITKADNGQSQARFESLTDVSLNGAELDFSVDGEVATIHWMAAGKSGVGQGKMLFDFLLSRYPVVSTGVEGENISYPAVRRLYTMQESGDYVVKPNGVKAFPGSASNEHKNRGRRKGRRTLKPYHHYYVARTDDASKIPATVVSANPGGMFGIAKSRLSATKARRVKSSMEAQVDSNLSKLLESKVARIDTYVQSKGLDVSGLNTEQKLSLILFGSAHIKLTAAQRKLIYDAHMIGDGRVIGEYTFADIRQKYVALRKSFTSKQGRLLMQDLQICGVESVVDSQVDTGVDVSEAVFFETQSFTSSNGINIEVSKTSLGYEVDVDNLSSLNNEQAVKVLSEIVGKFDVVFLKIDNPKANLSSFFKLRAMQVPGVKSTTVSAAGAKTLVMEFSKDSLHLISQNMTPMSQIAASDSYESLSDSYSDSPQSKAGADDKSPSGAEQIEPTLGPSGAEQIEPTLDPSGGEQIDQTLDHVSYVEESVESGDSKAFESLVGPVVSEQGSVVSEQSEAFESIDFENMISLDDTINQLNLLSDVELQQLKVTTVFGKHEMVLNGEELKLVLSKVDDKYKSSFDIFREGDSEFRLVFYPESKLALQVEVSKFVLEKLQDDFYYTLDMDLHAFLEGKSLNPSQFSAAGDKQGVLPSAAGDKQVALPSVPIDPRMSDPDFVAQFVLDETGNLLVEDGAFVLRQDVINEYAALQEFGPENFRIIKTLIDNNLLSFKNVPESQSGKPDKYHVNLYIKPGVNVFSMVDILSQLNGTLDWTNFSKGELGVNMDVNSPGFNIDFDLISFESNLVKPALKQIVSEQGISSGKDLLMFVSANSQYSSQISSPLEFICNQFKTSAVQDALTELKAAGMIEAAFENGVLFDVLTSFEPEVKIITKSNGQKEIFVQKRVLGRGGLGEVKLISASEFAAGQSEVGLAMKTTKDSEETFLDILKSEAAALRETAKWGSDHIIRMVDVAEDGSYILMETGADVMSMGPTLSQVMTVQEISEQLSGVANGLEMFWQRGYIHGDVKPCNIVSFVVNGKRVFKIIDIELKVMDGRHKRNLDNKQSLSDVKDFWYYQIARQPFTLQLSYFKSFIDPKLAQIFLGFRGDLIQSEFDKNPRSARLIAENIDFRLGKMDDLLGYFTTVCNVVENSQIKLSPEQIVELKALKSMILFDRNLTTDALSNLYFNFDSIVSRVKRFVGSLSQN